MSRLVTKGVKLADRLTNSFGLQSTVTHYPWTGVDDTYGGPSYGAGIARLAIVEMKQKQLHSTDGEDIIQRAVVTFLRPIAPDGSANRVEPIDMRDKIVLPSGYTGPILRIDGMENPDTSQPYMFEVILG